MRKTIITSLVALLLMARSIELIAQEKSRIEPGTRVRVTVSKFFQKRKDDNVSPAAPKSRYVGAVVALNADTLVIRAEEWPEPLFIPFTYFKKLELSRGRKSRVGKGALTGFLVGTGVGAGLGAAICPSLHYEDSGTMGLTEDICIPVGVASFALIGTGIGAIVGSHISGENWEKVPLEKIRMSILPNHNHGFLISK